MRWCGPLVHVRAQRLHRGRLLERCSDDVGVGLSCARGAFRVGVFVVARLWQFSGRELLPQPGNCTCDSVELVRDDAVSEHRRKVVGSAQVLACRGLPMSVS